MLKKIFSVSYCSNIIPQLVINKKIQNNNDNYYYSTIYLCIKEYKDESYKFIPYSKDSNNDLIWTGSQLSSSKKSKLSQSGSKKHNIDSEESSGTNSKETTSTRFSQADNPVVMR